MAGERGYEVGGLEVGLKGFNGAEFLVVFRFWKGFVGCPFGEVADVVVVKVGVMAD